MSASTISTETFPSAAEFCAALWISDLLATGGTAVAAFPDDLDEFAAQFFLQLR